MSNFQKGLFQKKLKELELQLGFNLDEETIEEETDSLSPLRGSISDGSEDATTNLKLPSWIEYFDVNDVYETDSHFKINTYYKKPLNNSKNPIIFICHHGAGSSGLTFGELSKSLRRKFDQKYKKRLSTIEYELPGLFTFDLRGHSKTALLNDEEVNFSMEQFSKDFVFLLNKFLEVNEFKSNGIKPSLFLIGHSLGGSVLTNVLHNNLIKDPEVLAMIKGLTMLDIVEEAAVQSLHAMGSYLDKTPKSFATIEESIKWHLSSKLVNNELSAKLSVPSYFRLNTKDNRYHWIADLYKTQPFWGEWFQGLSSNFVSINSKVAKLLILAGHDNLDKYLMIGQMQGKYQLVVFQDSVYVPELGRVQHCGHFVHEDCPDKVALTLIDYVERNDISRNDKPITIKWGSMG